jgi:Asp/Glu/hydantoin racemase
MRIPGQRSGSAVALNYFAYNFIQLHLTQRTSPAMAAGVTDRLWSVADLVALWDSEERRGAKAALVSRRKHK